jgi:glycosyltransferase involved in cell wall biosynthesis
MDPLRGLEMKLNNLFCLDPLTIPYLEKYQSPVKVSHLADPVQIYNQSGSKLNELRESLGIEADKEVFMLFGSLSDRKGIHQLLEAVLMLPADLAEKLCLLLVGPSVAIDRTRMENRMAEILQSLPVKIIRCDQFIFDREIQAYFQIADVILAPYQRHVGMSAILVRAAAAQKPVLSSDYGLMGEITRRYELGLTVDSRFPKEIAQGITQMLRVSPTKFGNPDKMKSFAQENAAERFAQVIFDHL